MKYLKKNRDTLSLLQHILESAEIRFNDPEIDPDYKKHLENRIPVIKAKIQSFEESLID